DLKGGVELGLFEHCKQVISFSEDVESTVIRLKEIVEEVERRYRLFRRHECVNLEEYNKKFKRNKLKKRLVVIDEFAPLSKDKDAIKVMTHLASQVRACGISLLITTQRPSAKILDGDIKANFNVVLGLKAKDVTNSRIIID